MRGWNEVLADRRDELKMRQRDDDSLFMMCGAKMMSDRIIDSCQNFSDPPEYNSTDTQNQESASFSGCFQFSSSPFIITIRIMISVAARCSSQHIFLFLISFSLLLNITEHHIALH